MDKRNLILQYIAKNPGVLSIDINVGLNRSSIGAHTKALLDDGKLMRDNSNGWHIAKDCVVDFEKNAPIDIAGEHIRKMIDVPK
jgi:predicted transcriptional regulator